ncbi:MAG TPA: hypothetical protein VGO36_00425 [Solirubrobacterales bacterium]|nr:hypothetical protein [Solirubrobacterales bacterium]
MALLAAAPAQAAKQPTQITLLWLPAGTSVQQLAQAGLSPGLISAGLGKVPAQQTYLDISQGNRVFDSLYDTDLPVLSGSCPNWWSSVHDRADSAPAEIVPGLLTVTLEDSDLGVRARGEASCVFSRQATSDSPQATPKKLSEAPRPHALSAAFEVREASLDALPFLLRRTTGNDLLIAIAKPPPAKDHGLAIGIAGRGFDGNLTSDTTRTDGYVLSTDVAPTILDRLGIDIPKEMSGQPIRAEGEVDTAAIVSLGDRMAVISDRRGPVIGLSLLAWVVVLGLLAAVSRGRQARVGVRMTGLAVIYLPLMLLLGAAIEPSEGVEMLIALLGAPLLAATTLGLFDGYRALAVASALTVSAYAVDVISGSSLTTLALIGPNPGLGVRFYGIGNELEATLAVLIVAGTGAGLSGFAPRLSRRRCAAVFLAIGFCAAFIFAAGRFGADVGAAIVFPLGAAVAAAIVVAARRRLAWLILALPFAMLALLALVDLVSGANAHLTRSVLDAGGLGALGEVAQRRLQLSVDSFSHPIVFVFLPLIVALAALALARRDRIRAWLAHSPAMRAGLIGAVAATVVGTLANDSGALLLEIGTAYLLVFTGFAWAESGAAGPAQAGR